MRARTIREGSVGLLILVGIGLLGFLILWLRGVNTGQRNYRLRISFEQTAGMQVGAPVRYRGVPVGRITAITPQANTVDVEVEITQNGLRMPAGVKVESNQSGLIGEASIDITPLQALNETELTLNPVAANCDNQVILCDGDRLEGFVGISYDDLLRSSDRIADFLTDPEIGRDISGILANTNTITRNTVGLTEAMALLVQDARQELRPLANSARQSTEAAGRAAQQFELTAGEVNRLLMDNRSAIAVTLQNVQISSDRLRVALDTLAPVIQDGELLTHVEVLAANAAAASQNLNQITAALNTSENLVLLQQTLESARDVFQSAQKIMADVDELTGDPTVRNNFRDLINGLTNLVSSTQQLETETQLAQLLQTVDQVSAAELPGRLPTDQPRLVYDGRRYVVHLADRPMDRPVDTAAAR